MGLEISVEATVFVGALNDDGNMVRSLIEVCGKEFCVIP